MQYPDFSKARVGDRVWSINKGWGTVRSVNTCTFTATFDDNLSYFYDDNGFGVGRAYPELYWSEITIPPEALTPPKRTRKETRWFFVYPKFTTSELLKCSRLYYNKRNAQAVMESYCEPQGPFSVEIEADDD